jgi:hypothetical protein
MNQESPKSDQPNDTPPPKLEVNKIKPDAGDKKLQGDRDTANFNERKAN